MPQPSSEMSLGMRRGTVTTFNDTKGYGFVRPDGETEDVFVHYSAIISRAKRRTLMPGQVVEFELVRDPASGPKRLAQNLRILNTRREAQG